ncbi:uncharacterized protein DUF5077 [Dysgonomonas alginatilytica]|uniref:Uncharacterized protein DUF5077 n=1 Tax=Dysgonomonas alginatilytica TaxID=1605892 RepID=A0A2V3PW83_9BACT|nr:DUF3472 domain-containing protein [Dysgonomonas alginatilytica]PXV69054.1 uncharacterized protein DUF5077 [Dysgonomonas alginatilytica]
MNTKQRMKYLKHLCFTVVFFLLSTIYIAAAPINIPLGANAYLTRNTEGAKINDTGVSQWKDNGTVISSWFRINRKGKINLSVRARAFAPDTKIQVTAGGKNYPITLSSKEWTIVPVANNIEIDKIGYFRIDIQGTSKSGEFFADLSDLVVDGTALEVEPDYVHDFSYHFGRRGPSVHLKYPFPEKESVEYFHNEVTVPQGEDIIGSYYMANGFGQGYFGIQVNSETERRVLFSVWSPFDTQDPKEIPEDQQIKTLQRGKDVHIGEFGNEGSGGQSYLKYMWKAGTTYRFLTRIYPDGKGNTVYTAYFYATDESEWRLIASFLRPNTDTWYTNAYSFLENFIPNQGYITRKVEFGNQWVVTNKGKWIEITNAAFTYDATAKAKMRLDYAGGEVNNRFFLQNCGFFDQNTEYNTPFKRPVTNKRPDINLKKITSIK